MYWYNGQLIKSKTIELAIDDPGLLYGATVFTTLRVYDGSLDSRLTHWRSHCDRLKSNLESFGWQLPSEQRLRQGALSIAAHFPVLRMTVFPDGREWIIGRNLPEGLIEKQNHGILAYQAKPELSRCLPDSKSGNYLGAWLAKSIAQQLNAQEAILVDEKGNWLETSTGNLWGWLDGSWWTPRASGEILPGIMRGELVKWLRQEGLVVREEPWTSNLVRKFEALAYSNSVVETVPIHTVSSPVGKLEYNPHHPCFQQLRMFFVSTTGAKFGIT
ncbi:aminotransferase class IV [Scytonema sp. NUACC26]|uniref:aminotransferase class IV n=1 Tax=Scytonema sp. NUACC26 TaxID=3140176 RepID=UPI0038B39351